MNEVLQSSRIKTPKVKVGDIVEVDGTQAVIASIYGQDWLETDGWDIEFIDTTGQYRHWKQFFDGGRVIYRGKHYGTI